MQNDKNIQIGFTFNGKKNTISIKESVLDLFSLTVTHHQKKYSENKKAVNKLIKNTIGHSNEIQGLSGKVSKFLLQCVAEETRSAIERNLEKDEIQTIANTLYEFVETNNQEVTREKEINKIRALYKKMYKITKLKNKHYSYNVI